MSANNRYDSAHLSRHVASGNKNYNQALFAPAFPTHISRAQGEQNTTDGWVSNTETMLQLQKGRGSQGPPTNQHISNLRRLQHESCSGFKQGM